MKSYFGAKRSHEESSLTGLVEVGAHVSGRWAGERIPWGATLKKKEKANVNI